MEGIRLGGIDIAIVIIYLIGMLAVGFASKARASKSTEQYLVAGRNLGFWMFFPCMSAVILGGGSTMGATKLGYVGGLGLSWFLVWQGLGVITLGIFMSKKLVRLKITTVGELFSLRFGNAARMYSAAIMAIFTIMLAVIQIISVGAILHALLGWNLIFAMAAGGGVALVYSFVGGMVAITFTDFIQWIIMTIGVIFVLLPASFIRAGGFEGWSANLSAAHLSFTSGGFMEEILPKFILYFLGIMVDQSVWQRLFTGKDTKTAYVGTIASGIYSLVYGLACIFIGMSAFIIVPNLDMPQTAFARVAVECLPPVLLGIVLSGVLSAIMSTMSGPLLATTTLVLKDIIVPLKNPSEAAQMKLTKILMITFSAVAMFFAIAFQDIVVALDVAYAVLSGGLFVPIICALFWKRATNRATIFAMVVSTIVIIISMMNPNYGPSSHWPIIYGFITSIIVLPIATMLTKQTTENHLEERLLKSDFE